MSKPVVTIDTDALNNIKYMALANDAEAACHLLAERTDDGYIVYGDAYIPPQIVTGVTVDTDPMDYAMWCASLPDEVVENMRCHAHSHVNMQVFSSGTDDEYQLDQIKQVQDFYIFIITNKRNELYVRVYDMEQGIMYDNDDLEIVTESYTVPADVAERWQLAVRKPQPVQKPGYNKDWYNQMVLEQIERKQYAGLE